MSDIALQTVGLGKMYHIGGERQRNTTLRDTIARAAMRPLERVRHPGAATHSSQELWALKDINLEVGHGDVLGVIGRNGAGKSTLLKVLSHITEPTEGRAQICGRVGSLLEVGTGFHPELTGRENIMLNGAILGMTRVEIKRRFDDIVEFSETGRFLDTPVKRYSSGMYVRLAFAVAAHLDPDILMIDEVLSVGDAEFQRKCLTRMDEIGREGRTILFVSHNLSSVARLCSRAILLDSGSVAVDGPADSVVEAYLRRGVGLSTRRTWGDSEIGPGTNVVKLRAVEVVLESGVAPGVIEIKQPIGIALDYDVLRPGYVLVPNIHVNFQGACAFVALDTSNAAQSSARPCGSYRSTAWIPGNLLAEGTVSIDVAISTLTPNVPHFYASDAVAFQVYDDLTGGSSRGIYAEPLPGVVRPLLEWETHST
jgi:lipopolysaccharide transport system ATP-binding protein